MKNILFLTCVVASISACSSIQTNPTDHNQVGLANPASQYCIDQGGKLEIAKEANGEVGYCHLKNGQKIEEWALFHQNQSQCDAESAAKLVGKVDLTDTQIKQATHATLIRRIKMGQPVTMDYRIERITLTVDPATKKVLQATCG